MRRIREMHSSMKLFLAALTAALSLTIAACNRSSTEAAETTADKGSKNVIESLLGSEPRVVQIPVGTPIAFAIDSTISSQSSNVGDTLTGELQQDVVIDEEIALPAGTKVRGSVTNVRPLKKIGGHAELALEVNLLITPSGQEVPVLARFARVGKSETARDSATIAAGAVVGAVIGHQVEGDTKGRAVGGLLGAGVGTAIAAETEGETIVLPAGTILELELLEPTAAQVDD